MRGDHVLCLVQHSVTFSCNKHSTDWLRPDELDVTVAEDNTATGPISVQVVVLMGTLQLPPLFADSKIYPVNLPSKSIKYLSSMNTSSTSVAFYGKSMEEQNGCVICLV